MVAHFVITLFNLALWDTDKHRAPTRTGAWLDARCRLFERFCLPSMAAQRGAGGVRWLVMFDADTPPAVRSRIDGWRRRCPVMEPLFFTADQVRGFTGRAEGRRVDFITHAIAERLDSAEKWVLTTNLDNDDALAADALARIEAAFSVCPRRGVISLVNGWQYLTSGRCVMAMSYPHNHFLTLAEPAGDPLVTVESMSHRRARKLFPVTDLAGEPGWLEVVHEGNVSNELRVTSRIGYRPLWGRQTLSRFGIPEVLPAFRQTMAMLMMPAVFLKVGLWRLRRKLWK